VTVKVDLSGFDDAEQRFRMLSVFLQKAVSAAFTGMIALMTGPKSGRRYKLPGTQTIYQASAPGEAPAVRTTFLRTSITIGKVNDYEYIISIAAPYGKILEFQKNRPFAIPASEKAWAVFQGVVRKYFNG
jgi:hypothetical protein